MYGQEFVDSVIMTLYPYFIIIMTLLEFLLIK